MTYLSQAQITVTALIRMVPTYGPNEKRMTKIVKQKTTIRDPQFLLIASNGMVNNQHFIFPHR